MGFISPCFTYSCSQSEFKISIDVSDYENLTSYSAVKNLLMDYDYNYKQNKYDKLKCQIIFHFLMLQRF